MSEEQTCGKGLAENARFPERLAAATAAMAEVLAFHRRSLALNDAASQREDDAYAQLVREYLTTALERDDAMLTAWRG